jgi:hypothetical protein
MAQTYEFGPLLEATSVVSVHAGSRIGADGFERPVSLSVVQPELARDRQFSRAFVEAAECFANISHPGTQKVEDLADEGGRLFSVSPAIDGGSLAAMIDCPAGVAKAISPDVACRVVRTIAEAVTRIAAALGAGAALGGLSAEAVWVTCAGDVLVMPTAVCTSKVPPRCRRIGAGRYRAPELDRCKSVTPAADVYSLGLLLWDLLSHGRAPASDLDAATRALSPIVDSRVIRIVMRCVSPAPEERPVNVAALGIELAKTVRSASSIRNSDIARALGRTLGKGAPEACEAPSDTIEIRTDELRCMAPAMTYDVAEPPIRHVSDFAKGARPAIPRPRGPGLAKTRPRALTFEPRLVAPDGSWLRLAGRIGRWVVGRGHTADLVALDPDMSRQHFEVVLGSDGSFRVRDLGSKNGLFVNGARARTAPLRAGDELRAGATILRFEV